jgi:hypothetical protein
MAQTKPKAAQFYGVSGDGTAGQVLISDGNGGMSWGANTEEFTVSWNTPTGQSLTYTQPSPQSSQGTAGSTFPTTTFTATKSGEEISGTATIVGLPTGITAAQSLSGTGADNILTVTLAGVFPGADSLNTALTISGLTIAVPITVDYLVVAGGGAGGGHVTPNAYGAGGGAGGYLTGTENTAVIGTNYLITVGAGATSGTNGSNSQAFSTTATGGGGGGWYTSGQPASSIGKDGGSGGGGSSGWAGSGMPPFPGGSKVSGQGNDGGECNNSGGYQSAGGGGAGAAGTNVSGAGGAGGNGGVGLSSTITGSSVFYAGGGGGEGWNGVAGAGGNGGGGAGASYNPTVGPAVSGTANTGGGGGGAAGVAGAGGAGGSGIVILRYPSSYAITVPGGLTATTDSTTVANTKITTFTAGTGNIQFN